MQGQHPDCSYDLVYEHQAPPSSQHTDTAVSLIPCSTSILASLSRQLCMQGEAVIVEWIFALTSLEKRSYKIWIYWHGTMRLDEASCQGASVLGVDAIGVSPLSHGRRHSFFPSWYSRRWISSSLAESVRGTYHFGCSERPPQIGSMLFASYAPLTPNRISRKAIAQSNTKRNDWYPRFCFEVEAS